ncbi:MAG: transcription factor [Candidatus Bathyarchaeota archaeon]|nr:transcription factor [Candidatus Bathyarchaeota archaeon]
MYLRRLDKSSKLLEFIASSIIGRDGVKLVKLLEDGVPRTVEEIAFQTGIRASDIRKALYILSNLALASTVREYGGGQYGVYQYKWILHKERVEGFITQERRKILKRLKERMEFEEGNQFYACGNEGCPRYTFDEAMDLNFRCERCGAMLKPIDNSRFKEILTKKIEEMERTLR